MNHLYYQSKLSLLKDWGTSFLHLGKLSRMLEKNIQQSRRALELAANIGTAAVTRSPRKIPVTKPDKKSFVHQGKGL